MSEADIMQAYTIIFEGLEHLGPGDVDVTQAVLERIRPSLPDTPRVADMGCGTGASALALASALDACRLLAIDAHTPFIDALRVAAAQRGLAERIEARTGDMSEPPSLDGIVGQFDLIWSESAIYSIGRSRALGLWRALVAEGGAMRGCPADPTC